MGTARPKIAVTRNLPEAGLALLRPTCDLVQWQSDDAIPRAHLKELLADADGCLVTLTERFDADLFDAAPRLRVVANFAVGTDNFDIAEATRRSVLLTNTPDVLTETSADLAWALLMTAARHILSADRYIRAGHWTTWNPRVLLGQDIYGATLGIIGFGRIGQAVARRARGFNMRVLYASTRRHTEEEATLGVEYRADRDDLLREADFVSLHMPLTPSTHYLLDDAAFALMKPTAVLVNTARGLVVDPDALYRALSEGRIFAAGLDVTEPEPLPHDHPLLALPNCVVAPHIASASFATRDATCILAAQNLLAALRGERPSCLVNPEAWTGA